MMRNKITYEWVFEEIENDDGDIVDPMFCGTLKEALAIEPDDICNKVEIALIRNEGNDEDGLLVREYAYVKDGRLPDKFDDGYKVPARFHKEAEDIK